MFPVLAAVGAIGLYQYSASPVVVCQKHSDSTYFMYIKRNICFPKPLTVTYQNFDKLRFVLKNDVEIEKDVSTGNIHKKHMTIKSFIQRLIDPDNSKISPIIYFIDHTPIAPMTFGSGVSGTANIFVESNGKKYKVNIESLKSQYDEKIGSMQKIGCTRI